ncbi:hypothetical protein PsYK624_081580 [Phanerochaete sordida]|uniref:Uncharacterized protein n=1 Tax=Phanerochaete sordida TaxID=48140 RepID=A0A9P3LE84_9APHY|nr:hypothetical protein PsYK624_081580 [Phanerochaete sordida]
MGLSEEDMHRMREPLRIASDPSRWIEKLESVFRGIPQGGDNIVPEFPPTPQSPSGASGDPDSTTSSSSSNSSLSSRVSAGWK